MLKHDEYIEFKQRSRKHMIKTLDSFEFWGERVGRIRGDIKEKWGEARWYAELGPSSLFELINVDSVYTWHPEDSLKHKILNTLNNMSISLILFAYLTIAYKFVFYNIAYISAMAKNPDCARDILLPSDYPKRIVLAKPFIFMVSRYQKLKKSLNRSKPPK